MIHPPPPFPFPTLPLQGVIVAEQEAHISTLKQLRKTARQSREQRKFLKLFVGRSKHYIIDREHKEKARELIFAYVLPFPTRPARKGWLVGWSVGWLVWRRWRGWRSATSGGGEAPGSQPPWMGKPR